jgi:hypothetical protein
MIWEMLSITPVFVLVGTLGALPVSLTLPTPPPHKLHKALILERVFRICYFSIYNVIGSLIPILPASCSHIYQGSAFRIPHFFHVLYS